MKKQRRTPAPLSRGLTLRQCAEIEGVSVWTFRRNWMGHAVLREHAFRTNGGTGDWRIPEHAMRKYLESCK